MGFVSGLVNQKDLVLDIGCGNKCYGKNIKQGTFSTVDILPELKANYILDIEKEDLPFDKDSFDLILLLDFIEHLTKKRGLEILLQCQQVTKKNIILSTPLDWTNNIENVYDHIAWKFNPHNLHRSLWKPSDFNDGWSEIEGLENLQNQYVGLWEKK